MLKFFYRLKRRHGVVLFAVIAIMTLLIAMATTAYFTARSSFQTVVSNYDFSQTYLSAIAISDMLVEAVTQNSSHNSTDYSANNFAKLKEEVQKLRDKTPNTPAATITGYTIHNGSPATESNILAQAASDPVEAGIFDAAKVEIKYIKKEPVPGSTTQTNHYFTFTTTVYYRDTTITVQDTIINTSGSKSNKDANPFNRFFTATSQNAVGQGSRVVIIDAKDISDDTYFENKLTAIGVDEHAGNKFNGSVTTSGSLVLYQFDDSGIKDPTENDRNDWFIGGDLIMAKNADSLDLKGNNLYVGGDLIIARGGGGLINAANIYVKGHIYYVNGGGGSGSGGISGNVYCNDTVESTDSSKVKSRIDDIVDKISRQGYDPLFNLSDGSTGVFDFNRAGDFDGSELVDISNPEVVNNPSGTGKIYQEKVTNVSIDEALKDKTSKRAYSNYTCDAKAYENELNINVGVFSMDTSSLPTVAELTDASHWKYKGLGYYDEPPETIGDDYHGKQTVSIHIQVNPDNTVTYTKTTVGEIKNYINNGGTYVGSTPVNKKEEFTYSTSGSVYTFKSDDGSSMDFNKSTNTATVTGAKGGGATITKDGNRIVVDVDYYKDGYLLGLYGAPSNGNITYNFHTKTKPADDTTDDNYTMPVVLKSNFKDSTDTPADQNGNNAFSWVCSTDSGSANEDWSATYVNLIKDSSTNKYGNVIFEMGNYTNTTDSETGKVTTTYAPYVRANDASTNVPTYYETVDLLIGTKDQVGKITSLSKSTGVTDFYESEKNYAQDTYKNHIMLVSNKNDGKNVGTTNVGPAINGDNLNHLLCGYIYAPNGAYTIRSGDEHHSVFGGMIVSVYDTQMGYFYYCAPDPEDIAEILKKMNAEEYITDPVPDAGVWSLEEGRNYLG